MDENDKAFLKFLSETQRIDANGRLDLEAFCFHFAQCLSLDELSQSVSAQKLAELMVGLILEKTNPPKNVRFIQQIELGPWCEEWVCIYPVKKRTVIHAAALMIVWDMWLKAVGRLMGFESEVWFHVTEFTHKVSWLPPHHQFTYALFRRIDIELREVMRDIDRKTMGQQGYSTMEAFTLAVQTDSDVSETQKLLRFLNDPKKSKNGPSS